MINIPEFIIGCTPLITLLGCCFGGLLGQRLSDNSFFNDLFEEHIVVYISIISGLICGCCYFVITSVLLL